MTRLGCPATPRETRPANSVLAPGSNRYTQPATTGDTAQRKGDRDRRFPLKGWDADWSSDDGIVGWSKRLANLESKRGHKKASAQLEAEHYFSVTHRCPTIEDGDLFLGESLHPVHRPKPKPVKEAQAGEVKLRLTTNNSHSNNSNDTHNISKNNTSINNSNNNGFMQQPAALVQRSKTQIELRTVNNEEDTQVIKTYRDNRDLTIKEEDPAVEKRCQSAQEMAPKPPPQLERSYTNVRIKRLLKFSRKERPTPRQEEDEDEGYSSKTSSAERRAESDGDESTSGRERNSGIGADIGNDNRRTFERSRTFASILDLTDMRQNEDRFALNTQACDTSRTLSDLMASKGRFNYTHQPTILQLPNPDIMLTHDRLRIEKKIESEDATWSYAKLKRSKELNRCYKPDILSQAPEETSSVYDIDNNKPVTLVLRKISIQNADKEVTSLYQTKSVPGESKTLERNKSRSPVSRAGSDLSRAGSAMSRVGSAMSRVGSAKSRAESRSSSAVSNAGSPASRAGSQTGFRASSRTGSAMSGKQKPASASGSPDKVSHKLTDIPSYVADNKSYTSSKSRPSLVRDVKVVDARSRKMESKSNSSKEPMWNQQYSFIDRQATSYCIGDLLPAVDKNIYTRNSGNRKYEDGTIREEVARTELVDFSREPANDDGYVLLKRGMEMLAEGSDKLTLGPPPFRPNQSRHPLMIRNTTVVANCRREFAAKSSPSPGSNKLKHSRNSSDRPRPSSVEEEKEVQRKLKEAFTQFYRNRPQEVGREFRRMQTMWKS